MKSIIRLTPWTTLPGRMSKKYVVASDGYNRGRSRGSLWSVVHTVVQSSWLNRNKEVETREYNRILNVKWLHCEYQSSPEYNLHFEILEILV